MRYLRVLPCPESWARMRPDGDGRYCERCQLRVTEVAKLDGEGLDELIAAAEGERVCARFELDGGRPRIKTGLAAGLVVVALAGCATPDGELRVSAPDEAALTELVDGRLAAEDSGAVIAGIVRDTRGLPLANAIVVLQSTALGGNREQMTNARGLYSFGSLPPGNYTIQVLYGNADVSKITELPENARFRANFAIDPDAERGGALLGVVVKRPLLDTTSASSSSSSRLIEYD